MPKYQLAKLSLALLILFTAGCASLPDNKDKTVSYAFDQPKLITLGKAVARKAEQYPAGQSAYHLLSDGLDAFVARAVLAEIAERSIDSQYYMVHGDLVGLLYMGALLNAADRGVRV